MVNSTAGWDFKLIPPDFAGEPLLPADRHNQIPDNKKGECFTFALWVGKLPTSRRYNLLPLLRSSPGGFAGSWPYRTYPYTCIYSNVFTGTHACVLQTFTLAKVVHFFHLSKHNDKIISNAATLPNITKQKQNTTIDKNTPTRQIILTQLNHFSKNI